MKGSRKVMLRGKGLILLPESSHVATGGEASVFRHHDLAIKIYTNPKSMRERKMDEKVKLLAALSHPALVAPMFLVDSEGGEPIGLATPFVDGQHLPPLFTNDFRKKVGFGLPETNHFVALHREATQFAHSKGAVIVDGNELNILVAEKAAAQGKKVFEPRLIDVDSWAIGPFAATAIMDSIRDHHTKGFTPASDWFSWAVVSFQLYTGIHPYKGNVPGYGPRDLVKRMQENVSVFDSRVRLNAAVRDISSIPSPLRAWYEAVFTKKERGVPPSPFDVVRVAQAAQTMRVVTHAHSALPQVLVHTKLWDVHTGDSIAEVYPCGVVRTESGVLYSLSSRAMLPCMVEDAAEVVRVDTGLLVCDKSTAGLRVRYVAADNAVTELVLPVVGERFFRAGDRVFVVGGVTTPKIIELSLTLLGRPILTLGTSWDILPLATKFFNGVAFQDALGSQYALVPFGDGACAHVRMPELDRKKVVSAFAVPRFVSAVIAAAHGYEQLEFTLNKDYTAYTLVRCVVDDSFQNATMLPKGVVVRITEDGSIDVTVPTAATTNRVADRGVCTSHVLARMGDTLLYIKPSSPDSVWSLRMQ